MKAIHSLFFSNKNVLTINDRKAFIDIFYEFLILKIIEIEAPDSFSITCKDGVDDSGTVLGLLYAYSKIVNETITDDTDMSLLNTITYSTPLIIRERIMQPKLFHRMLAAIRAIEGTRETLGKKELNNILKNSLSPLFKSNIIHTIPLLPDWSELY